MGSWPEGGVCSSMSILVISKDKLPLTCYMALQEIQMCIKGLGKGA